MLPETEEYKSGWFLLVRDLDIFFYRTHYCKTVKELTTYITGALRCLPNPAFTISLFLNDPNYDKFCELTTEEVE